MGAQFRNRLRLTLPLLLPSVGGLAYLNAFDAPVRLIAVNAGALAVALAWIMLGRWPASRTVRLVLATMTALALFLPLLLAPEVGGVTRWIPAGPVSLHSGALLLPLLVVFAASEPRFGPAMLALAGTALALQPDAAVLCGLAAASAVLAWCHRSIAFAAIAAAGLMLAILTFAAGTLEPQVFTENVLAQVAARSLPQALVLAALLFLAPLWQLVLSRPHARFEGASLAAMLIALGTAAMLAPFPFPLIGFGASSILGFGLALGAFPAPPRDHDRFLATA